jgi:hypothetical protein
LFKGGLSLGNLTKQLTLLVGIMTFLLISILGIIGEVSWGVIFIRAITASLVVSLMTYLALYLILDILVKEHLNSEESTLNLMLGDEINIDELIDTTEEQPGKMNSQTETIKPFVPNRFDSDIENIIKDDPVRAAEIISRMGLDE